MHTIEIPKFFFRLRSAVFGLAAAGLFCACLSRTCQAQRAGVSDGRSRMMERIDQEEGARRMASFRAQRLNGDFCFRFELEHLPRRGKTVRYSGTMWGSWNVLGPVSRFELSPAHGAGDAESSEVIELIVQNGASPQAWIRKAGSSGFEAIVGDAVFEPILPGVVYSPFDLQMPFIYWQDFEYEGPGRVQSRIAQRFRMLPPKVSASADRGVRSVRIALDDVYDALLRVEVLGAADDVLSRFTVESFKKVQEQYIVKKITLKDSATKDSTRFRVRAASVGLVLNASIFDPDSEAPTPVIPSALFDVL